MTFRGASQTCSVVCGPAPGVPTCRSFQLRLPSLGREISEAEVAAFQARCLGLGVGIELRQPAAAKVHVHVQQERLDLVGGRIEIDDRRFQPHRDLRDETAARLSGDSASAGSKAPAG